MATKFQKYIKKNEKIIGTIASALAIIMIIAIIEVFISNIKGNSNIFIQPLALALNGVFWILYAYSKKDWFLLAPNILAFFLGIITAISAFI